MVYIGIDLGTTYSSVSVVENGKPTIIFGKDGKILIPSIVAFLEKETLTGYSALAYNTEVTNVLYDSKRLIGWQFLYELPNAESRELWTFNAAVKNKKTGYILHKGKENERFVPPEEVAAEILKYLKKIAENYLRDNEEEKVTGAVVTIPVLFTESQIAATKKAIEMADLNLVYLLHEPTAAAIAFNHMKKFDKSNLLIFDFGGGTLDICIAEIKNKMIKIKAVANDAQLGGQDLDGKIMRYAVEQFRTSNDYDILKRPKLIRRLRAECREAKEALSFGVEQFNIHVDIDNENELNVEITRTKMDELCEEFFKESIKKIDKALNTAQMIPQEIDYVILIGGSSRIKKVRELLEDKFGKEKLRSNIHPDQAVSLGAAIFADAIGRDSITMPLANLSLEEINSPNVVSLFETKDNDEDFENSDDKILYYQVDFHEKLNYYGKICLFDPKTYRIERLTIVDMFKTARTHNKIYLINDFGKKFQVFDLKSLVIRDEISPPEFRRMGLLACYNKKLYYIGGTDFETKPTMSYRVDIFVHGRWKEGPALPIEAMQISCYAVCKRKLYVIDDFTYKIYRLSDDETEWIEVGEMLEERYMPQVASLNGKIYITGGRINHKNFKTCEVFDPLAESGKQNIQMSPMSIARSSYELISANGKLYAIGGLVESEQNEICKSIEEYDPQTDKWTIIINELTEIIMVVMKVVNSLGRETVANVKIINNEGYLQETSLHDTEEIKWSFDPNSPNTSVFDCEVSTNSDWKKSWTVFEPNNEQIQRFGNEFAWFMRGDGIYIGTMLGDELIKVHNW